MAKKIIAILIAALTGPFAMALGITALIIVGVVVGVVIIGGMEDAKLQKLQAEKAAAVQASKGPPPPQRVLAEPEDGPSPFAPRYVSLGEEILSPLPGKNRVLQIEIDLVTQRGQFAEDLLIDQKIPLRALVLSMLSEMTVENATAADATQALAEKLKRAINAALWPKNSIAPVERVLIKKYYVQ